MSGTALEPAAGAIDATLVDEINRRHHEVEQHARATLESAIECGRLLAAAKGRLPHGGWLPWLSEHFDGSERTAQTYMRLHEHGDELLRARDGNPQRVADLSLRAALRDISAPREPRADPEHLHRIFPGLRPADDDAGAAEQPTPARAPASSTPSAPADPQDPPVTVDAEVMLDPPAILDAAQQRQWDRADDALAAVRELMIEAADGDLAPLSVSGALRDASHKARSLAGLLEGLAGAIEARERRRPAA